jgi:hypothetical protein
VASRIQDQELVKLMTDYRSDMIVDYLMVRRLKETEEFHRQRMTLTHYKSKEDTKQILHYILQYFDPLLDFYQRFNLNQEFEKTGKRQKKDPTEIPADEERRNKLNRLASPKKRMNRTVTVK